MLTPETVDFIAPIPILNAALINFDYICNTAVGEEIAGKNIGRWTGLFGRRVQTFVAFYVIVTGDRWV